MAAIDNLTELVERAAVAEKVALSSKWKDRPEVAKMITRVRKGAQEQRDELNQDTDPLVAVLQVGVTAAELPRSRRAGKPARATDLVQRRHRKYPGPGN